MAQNSGYIDVSVENNVMTIVLNRPERANAFTQGMIKDLLAALKDAERNRDVRVVVLQGAGKAFSAGQDVSEMDFAGKVSYQEHLYETYNPLILSLRRLEKPVLAVLNGAVAGAALGVALACDLRLASSKAFFAVGFLQLGLIPDSAVSLLLPLYIGIGRAVELTGFNDWIDAQKAFDLGLVNRVVEADKLDAEAAKWIKRLAAMPIEAFGLTKRAFNFAVMPNLEKVLSYEADLQEIAHLSPEHREGVQAFLEKRSPNFLGLKDL